MERARKNRVSSQNQDRCGKARMWGGCGRGYGMLGVAGEIKGLEGGLVEEFGFPPEGGCRGRERSITGKGHAGVLGDQDCR